MFSLWGRVPHWHNEGMTSPLILRPAAGLANRMRAIDSAIALCRRVGRPLEIVWFQDHALRAPFHTLFEPLNRAGVMLREATWTDFVLHDVPLGRRNLKIPLPYQWMRFRKNRRIGLWDNPRPTQILRVFENVSRPCLVLSGSQMTPTEDRYAMFRPVSPIQRRIEDLRTTFDRDRCVGVHVRRGDHRQATENSPVELFADRMRRELDGGQCDSFYLATDSEDCRSELSKRFGSRVVTQTSPACRQTVEGIQDAVVDLFVLAECRIILGSCGSTFGQTAAWMKTREYVEVRR